MAVLLGLTLTLVGPAQPGRGYSHEDQDYYLQELLAREQYGKMQVSGGEEPAASMPGPPETRLRQTPADKKNPRGGKTDSSRSPEKQTAKSKSGRNTTTLWMVRVQSWRCEPSSAEEETVSCKPLRAFV